VYGTWFTVTFGAIGVVLVVVALAFAAAPLLAVAIALLALAVIGYFAGLRRAKSERRSSAESDEVAGRTPERRGAPVSGEGGEPVGDGGTSRPEPQPEPASTGMWGERKE
jgi:hypothetical protein